MNINLKTKIIQRKDIDTTDIDGEKAMMNLEKGQYFMLNEVGSRIWDIISNECSVQEIASSLLNEYEIDEETCKQSVIQFIERLSNAELICIK
jgi:hypothetical protein